MTNDAKWALRRFAELIGAIAIVVFIIYGIGCLIEVL